MKQCLDCIHANWRRTKSGALHPNGDGLCTHRLTSADAIRELLPAAGFAQIYTTYPWIRRKDENRKPCPTREVQP